MLLCCDPPTPLPASKTHLKQFYPVPLHTALDASQKGDRHARVSCAWALTRSRVMHYHIPLRRFQVARKSFRSFPSARATVMTRESATKQPHTRMMVLSLLGGTLPGAAWIRAAPLVHLTSMGAKTRDRRSTARTLQHQRQSLQHQRLHLQLQRIQGGRRLRPRCRQPARRAARHRPRVRTRPTLARHSRPLPRRPPHRRPWAHRPHRQELPAARPGWPPASFRGSGLPPWRRLCSKPPGMLIKLIAWVLGWVAVGFTVI